MLDLCLHKLLAIWDHEEGEAEVVPTVSGTYFRGCNNPSILLSGSSHSYLFSGTSWTGQLLPWTVNTARWPPTQRPAYLLPFWWPYQQWWPVPLYMICNLFENYGIVPQSGNPESFHLLLSSPLNALLKCKICEHALILWQLSTSLQP